MKRITFLLLPACLLNTALSQSTGASSGGQVAVSQSAESPLEAATEVDPVLPFDILFKIASHADPQEGHLLRNADKALRAFGEGFKLKIKGPTVEPTDIRKIKESSPKDQAFYQAILKNDIDGVKRLYNYINDERIMPQYMYGLELAVRYNLPEVAWILLACNKKTDTERGKILRKDAESRQTQDGLADINMVQSARPYARAFYVNIILNGQSSKWLGMGLGLPKAERKSGLHLAVRYGNNMSIFVLLAFHTSDWNMNSKENKELVKLAKKKLPQTYLDFLDKENSVQEKRDVWETKLVIQKYIDTIGATNVS